ncbi:O-antigen ligase family protein [Micromonospora kangleipakensis]|uniref:O-antigen ligase family protein n=1 Tax=Micromonospora kangleipakensis TaxID=1077942 RepID=UPI0013EF1CED|nr:O-antigen ligase family protein [Micromonospora kangleipakensis]
MAIVGVLLVQVLLETWVQVLSGPGSEDVRGHVESGAAWLEQLRNVLYLALAVITLVKVAMDRQWARFRTGADLALLVLGLVMVLAGVVNDSSVGLIGQGILVYFRGVLVFYAFRAADLDRVMIRRVLLVAAFVVGLNVLLALMQMLLGQPAYRAVGVADMAWADQGRAQGLQPHPDYLGHLLGLALLGFVAWVAVHPRVRFGWWAVAALVALALSASQSGESLLGVLVAGTLIAVLVKGNRRRVLGVCLIVVLCTVAHIVATTDDHAGWERRLGSAFSGSYHQLGVAGRTSPPATGSAPMPSGAPALEREIRVLDVQQAADILPRQPLLGFGIGQFGGLVAEKSNPDWHRNPKFGPDVLSPAGVPAPQVDSFWLHLVMEAGVIGLIAYVIWLFFVVRPLLPRTARGPRRTTRTPPVAAVWGVAAMVFACIVATLSPAFEGALLPPLFWTILGVAWWAWRRSREEEASVYTAETAMLPVVRDRSDVSDIDTRILATDEILALALRARRRTDGR